MRAAILILALSLTGCFVVPMSGSSERSCPGGVTTTGRCCQSGVACGGSCISARLRCHH